ncbi:hypothetical protein T484DRAFT_1794906 [Baffinella frigidus]|nr:hypothetical protein T484DRAFT_1794906 [Cryptophyta sp. CCMP2293]
MTRQSPRTVGFGVRVTGHAGVHEPAGGAEYNISAPNNPYDLSKWTGDLYATHSKVEAYGLRLGTVCGGSPNLRSDVMLNAMTTDALSKKEVGRNLLELAAKIMQYS